MFVTIYNSAYYFYFIFILVFIFTYSFLLGRGFFRCGCGSAPGHNYLTFMLLNVLEDKVFLGNLEVLN